MATAGADTLSYSAYTTSVRVNLSTGVGYRHLRWLRAYGIENVTGGYGNDILIGE